MKKSVKLEKLEVIVDSMGFSGKSDPIMYYSPGESCIFLTGTVGRYFKKFKGVNNFYIVSEEAWNRRVNDKT